MELIGTKFAAFTQLSEDELSAAFVASGAAQQRGRSAIYGTVAAIKRQGDAAADSLNSACGLVEGQI